MDETHQKIIQIFEYLLAVKNLHEKVIRQVQAYEKVWWQTELPLGDGCFLAGKENIQEAWLEVHKQEVPSPPVLPKSLERWVKNWKNPSNEPVVISSIPQGIDEEGNEVYEFFRDDSKRVALYKEWLESKWKPWATEVSHKFKVQKLYMELFSLHQQIQREEELEIGWCHGLLTWQVQNETIQRHLLFTKLELQFDAKKAIFSLVPTSQGTHLETDMLMNVSVPNASRLKEMEQQLVDCSFSPEELENIVPLLKEVAHTISPDGRYRDVFDIPSKKQPTPIITFSPAIIVRKSGGRLWQNELLTAIEKLKEGYPIPLTLQALTTTERIEPDKALQSQWKSVGEQLLLPLPTNFEQKEIAKKISETSGVVVQGPPGTGKSHTIANLICHLLAHGKRVLVTSQKERALQVLKDKIPEEIRGLCVSVLGGDSRSIKEIENSIRTIAENMDSKQQEVLDKNIQHLQKQLEATKRNIADIETKMSKSALQEHEEIQVGELSLKPLEAAKWLKANEKHNWLPDEVKEPCPLTNEQLDTFFVLLKKLTKKDQEALEQLRPRVSDLPQLTTFEHCVEEMMAIEQMVAENERYIKTWQLPNKLPSNIDSLIKLTDEAIEKMTVIMEKPWLHTLLQDILADDGQQPMWEDFVTETEEKIKVIESLRQELIEYDISIPEEKEETLLKEDLMKLKDRFEQGKSVGWFFKQLTGRKLSYLFDSCKVNDLPIRDINDVQTIIKHLELKIIIKKLVLKWNRTMELIGGKMIDPNHPRFGIYIRERLKEFKDILNWNRDVVQPLQNMCNTLGIQEKPVWDQTEWYRKIYNGLRAVKHHITRQKVNTFFTQLITRLSKGREAANAHPAWNTLIQACKEKDVKNWTTCYKELNRLEGLEEDYKRFCELRDKLKNGAPLWVQQLIEQANEGEPIVRPQNLDIAWQWRQLKTALDQFHAQPSVEELERQLKLEREKESRLIRELVAESTWRSQIKRTTTKQKQSLFAWMKAIQRIGKGYTKYANIYRKQAKDELKTSRGAIPVWIMPIQRVIENIQLTDEKFDVVIVDESSQSDLFSLSALLRAEKAIIVGDDNQISPESVGTDIGQIHELIQRYLYNIPHAEQYEMRTSLYDTASRVFDSKIVLKEHFRCVPEIIQFSNDLMYGDIDPLRIPLTDEMLTPPVQAIRVPDGYREEHTKAINKPEAEAIVKHIENCLRDPRYKDKTFGVISLQGHDQAKVIENILRDTIGEEEMINRRLICGDAYSFQGDERDVMFLSLVAAPNMRIGTLNKRSDFQRFNVAASRARDQMILYHSVHLEHLNPECVRYKLLQYCTDPHRVQKEINEVKEVFDSQFEEDVYRMIVARGHRVIPQVKIGRYGKRIDLVVEGIRNRLAIECDGDHWHGLDQWEDDMERQRILERVGWTFWRVRGSTFYLDRAKALEPLWKKLDEMGIKPHL